MSKKPYELKIALSVLDDLGINLYSNTPAVLSETVANAYDADADNVEISIDSKENIIEIQDDGHGMSPDALQDKFLTIGYKRRQAGEVESPKYKRPVMGRKGIGKLSLFSIANKVAIYTTDGSTNSSILLDANEIRSNLLANPNGQDVLKKQQN